MTTVTKGKILQEDIKHWDGVTRSHSRKDSTGGTVAGNKLGVEVDVLAAYGSSQNFTRQSIQDCINRIGSTSVTLIFTPGTWTIDDDLTIGSNFTCRVPNGCVFSVSSGKTLTFSGPVIRDGQTWTSGSGTVTENGTRYISGLVDLSSAVIQGATPLVFEGSTANAFETSFVVTDPTAARTITFPDADVDLGSVVSTSANNTLTGNNTFSGTNDFTGPVKANGSAGTSGQVLQTTGTGVQWANTPPERNYLINGSFSIAQRGTSFTSATTPANNDDTYLLDRWILLSDGNDIVDVTQETSTVPTGGLHAIALDVETANKKFGILQIIEQNDCIGLIGNTCTLSFKAKVSSTTNLDNVKAAIISWDGTADTVTSDIISAWGIEGTNPTLAANWTYENTPANLSLTTSYATYSVSAAVDTASTKNVAVFIWSDVTTTSAGEFLYITDVKLEPSSAATSYVRRPFQEELSLCERYFEKSYDLANAPGTATYEGTMVMGLVLGGALSIAWRHGVQLKTRKRTSPTLTLYDSAGNSGKVNYPDTTTNVTPSASDSYETGFWYELTITNGTDQRTYCHYTSEAEL